MNDKPTGIANGLTNYGDRDFSLYLRRSFAQSMGYSRAMLAKPVVGIAYTPSGFNNCHRHFPEMLEAVKRGVLTAGALPIEFPTISLGAAYGCGCAYGRLRQDSTGPVNGRGVGRQTFHHVGCRPNDDGAPSR
jgi:hypothetical protein